MTTAFILKRSAAVAKIRKSKACGCPRRSRFWGVGAIRTGKGWGRFLRWRDPDGRPHEKFVADEALQGDPAAICAPLAAEGLANCSEPATRICELSFRCGNEGRVTVVHRTGWHEIEGDNRFRVAGREHRPQGCRPRVARRRGAWAIRGERARWPNGAMALAR